MKYHIGEDIKTVREMLNVSQEGLAQIIGADRKTILRLENNETAPTAETIERFYDFVYNEGINLNHIKEQLYKEEKAGLKVVFHGSKTKIVGDIDTAHGKEKNDFGKGFYCGESSEQALSYVSGFPSCCLYMIAFDGLGLKKAEFAVNQDWMLGIAYYRGRLNRYSDHPLVRSVVKKVEAADYVYAPIADNRMFQIIDQFIDGLITDEQCKHCLAATNLGNQFVFLNQKATARLEVLERCYVCESERAYYQNIREADIREGDNKVKMALIKYRGQGKYLEELLS